MEIKTIKIDNKEYEIKVNEDKTLTLTEIKKVKIRPNNQERYFVIWADGEISDTPYFDYGDKGIWNTGNGFFTKEEAEKELERRKVIQLLKEFKLKNDPVVLDWSNFEQEKWSIVIDGKAKNKCYCVYTYSIMNLNTVYFSSIALAKQAIEEIGEERIYNAFK